MRNLKRALSLALASVMLLGMMVTGAGAVSFPDVDEDSHNIEAIEVLQAVDVMIGDENGNFGPDDQVNRAQMAVIMAKLLNLNYDYYKGADPGFWDVPSWAAPYVAACHANGIVAGYGDGQYGSADGVTAVQAAAMMMRALGYFKYTEDLKDGFELATVRQGTEIGIFDGVGSEAGKGLTRNEVARMALNALESEMVIFTGTPGVTVNDVTVGYRAEYTPRTSTEIKYKAIEDRTSDVASDANHKGQYYIQLGEELYDGKLTKRFDRDEFERPSINWQYNGKEIGVYVDYDLKVAEYKTGVKYADLYELLTYSTINDNDLYRFTDGVDQNEVKTSFARSNKDEVGGTGVLTEVFVDLFRDEISITHINTYLARANSDYNKNNETLSLKVFKDNEDGVTRVVDSAVVPEAADVKKDDFMLVYLSGKENPSSYDVVDMFDVEIMADSTVTKFSKSKDAKVVDKLTTNGTEYSTNPKAFYNHGDVLESYDNQLLTNMSYNIYMDRYDNVIGVDLYEGDRNYVFITGYDRGTSHISVKTAEAAGIFLDGTMDTITVNVTDTDKYINAYGDANYRVWTGRDGEKNENRWYTYTVNNNGTYTLKPAGRSFYTTYKDLDDGTDENVILNSANLYVDDKSLTDGTVKDHGRAYGNDDSIYITVEAGRVDKSSEDKPANNIAGDPRVLDAITDVKGVYTGIQNVKLELTRGAKEEINNTKETVEKNAYVYTVYDSNYYIVASIVIGDAQGAAANYAYILGDAKSERVERDGDGRANGETYYWEFDAVVDGVETTLTAKTKYASVFSGLKPYHVQELRFDGDYVTSIKDVPADKVHTDFTTEDKIGDHDIYDVGHTHNKNTTSSVSGWKNWNTDIEDIKVDVPYAGSARIDGTIYLKGRTLYTDRDGGDVGLALANDAKAVLVQYENGKRKVNSCDTVAEAIGRLADKDTRTGSDGVQFSGRVAAPLKGGVAQWVVIISDTNLVTGNRPNYNEDVTATNGNISLYLTDSANVTVRDRDLSYRLSANGDMTISFPVDRKFTSVAWNRLNSYVTVNGVDCTDGLIAPRLVGNQVQISINGYRLTTRDEVVFYIDGLTLMTDPAVISNVNVTLKAPEAGKALPTAVSNTTGVSVNTSWEPNDAAAEAGKTYTATVTVSAKDGYTLDKDYTLTINGSTSADGKVSFTVEGGGHEGDEVTITVDSALTTGNSRITVNGTILGSYTDAKAEVGQTIKVLPSSTVVDVTGVADGKITGDVTITVKEGFTWSRLNELWMGTKPNGNMYTEAIPSLRMARAAVSDDIPVGDINLEEGWLGKISKDTGATYTITVGGVIWKGKIGAADGGTEWELTVGSPEEAKKAIMQIDTAKVEKTEAADQETFTLTLQTLLYQGAVAQDPAVKVVIVGQDGKTVTGKPYVNNDGVSVIDYEIPEGARVQIQHSNDQGNYFTVPNALNVGVGYEIDGVYVVLNRRFEGTYNTAVTLDFTMSKDMVMNLTAKDTFKEDGETLSKVLAVTSHNGVAATLKDSQNKEFTLPANGSIYVPAGTYTVKVTDFGEGKYVMGKNMPTLFTPGKQGTSEQAGVGIQQDFDLWSGVKVKSVGVTAKNDSWYTGTEIDGGAFIPVGTELKLSAAWAYGGDKNPEVRYFLAMDGTEKTLAEPAGSEKVITNKKYVVGTEDVTLWNAVEFTLGDGVEAVLGGWNSSTKKFEQMEGSRVLSSEESNTWYMVAAMVNNLENSSGKWEGKLLGAIHLGFNAIDEENKAVVDPSKLGIDIDARWTIPAEGDTTNWIAPQHITSSYVVYSEVWDGASWEAWTKVVAGTDSVDEAYIVNESGNFGKVFDDLYAIKPLTTPWTLTDAMHKRTFDHMEKTIFVDPNWGEALTIYAGAEKPAEVELVAEGYEVTDPAVDPFDKINNTHVCGNIVVGDELVELKVVEKTAG